MLFNDLFESDREPYSKAIDKLEVAHINALNAKMDEIISRVNREKLTPEHKQALKKEYIKLKAERDSIYGIKDGTPEFTVECDEEGNASVIDRIGQAIKQFTAQKYGSTAFDAATAYAGSTFKNADINDVAGWENAAARKTGPVRLRPVVKQKPQNLEVMVSEWRNTAPGADEEQRKLKKVGIVRRKAQVDEMDKSAEQPGRDGHVSNKTYGSRDNDKSSGKESQGKPTTAKQAAKDALDTLNKQELDEAAVNPQFINAQVTKILAGEARRMTNAPMAQLLAPVMKEYGLTLQQIDSMVPGGLKKAAGEYGIMMKEEYTPVTKPVPQPKKLNPGWALDPTTKAELKRRKDVRNRVGIDEANRDDENIIRSVFSHLHVDGGGGNLSYMIEKNAPFFDSLRTKYYDDIKAVLTQSSPKELAQAANELRKMFGRMNEGWSDAVVSQRTGQPRTPYSVYISGKKWKDFENDDHAENVANKLRAKFKADGRDPSVITIAPTDYDKDMKEGFGDTVKKAVKYAMGGARVDNAVRKHDRKQADAAAKGDYATAKKEVRRAAKIDNKFNPTDDPIEEGFGSALTRAGKYVTGASRVDQAIKNHETQRHLAQQRGDHDAYSRANAKGGRIADRFYNDDVEETMSSAAHNPDGPKFGGYYKGTQVGAPRPGQSFGAESVEHENPMNDKELAYLIAKAKGMKTQPDPALHKGDDHEIHSDKDFVGEGMNFMEWAVAQGSRFNNFAGNPEVYAKAKQAFFEDIYGGIPKIAKVPTGAMVSNAKLPTLKTNLRKAKEQKIRTAKALNKSLTEDEQLDEDLMSLFGEAQNIYSIYQFLKANAVPVALFVGAVLTYGLHNTLKTAKGDESKFMKMAKDAWNKVDHGKVEKIVAWLNNKFVDVAEKMGFEDPNGYVPDLTEVDKAEAELQPGQYYVWTVHFDDGTESKCKVTSDQFDPKAYYAKKNKVVIKTDYDWTIHG